MGGFGDVPALVACSEGGVGANCGVLARVRWVVCKRKWHAIISAIAIVEILS